MPSKKDIINQFKQKLSSDPQWAVRGMLAIYDRQTLDEQDVEETNHNNGVGFNSCDANIMTSFSKQYLSKKRISSKQLQIVYRVMPKYAGQLYDIAVENGKLEQ